MTLKTREKYSSKIIKAGALLSDTKILLANWNKDLAVAENLERFRKENVFGKASRSRIEDILPLFRQRYLEEQHTINALFTLVKARLPAETLNPILYYYSVQADRLLHDIVVDVLWPMHQSGRSEIQADEIQRVLNVWGSEGKTIGLWNDTTTLRVAQGVLSTLRDFGILEGASRKRLAPMFLPVEAFAYIAFCLKQNQPSGDKLIDDPEWRLLFLSRDAIERFLMEAHQRRLLEYQAAGSVIRITFPSGTIEEYANVILGTTN